MRKKLLVITLLVLLVGNLFANSVKSSFTKITKFGGNTYYWNLEATTPIDTPSSKDWNNFISEMKENGYELGWTRVITLSEAFEGHTGPIAEVLLARSYGCYSICAVYENDFYFSPCFYFVSEKDIFISCFRLTKQR